MDRPTLSRFRSQWPSEAMGVCQADPRVRDYCNDAQERLLMDPLCPDEGWWGGWVTLALTVSVSNGVAYLTTPREIARLIVTSVCTDPLHIRNGFYEYLRYGAGLQPKTCAPTCTTVFEAYERDTVATLAPLLSTAQTIRIYPTDSRDVGRRVLIQGKDANGQIVLTTDPGTARSAQGEYVILTSPFADTVNQWTSITGIQKDECYGNLQFFQVDPTTLVETALSSMEPGESTASYRRYMYNTVPNNAQCCTTSPNMQVISQGRIDFIPVVNETDYLTLPNVPALIEECRSIRFSHMDSPSAANQAVFHHGRAIALLNGQLDLFQGKVNTAVRVPIFGSQPLTRQPV